MDDNTQTGLAEGQRVDAVVKHITEALKTYTGEISYDTAMLACAIMAAVGATNRGISKARFLAICDRAYEHYRVTDKAVN